ncbi:glutamate-rich protein 6-like [Osmerus mordax]|uniref:glutamate-rich protein 6-like n=1 Tax=Osmerus mordax TaxID=8014 RepID=UPI003510ABA7
MEYEAALASRWRAEEDVMLCAEGQPIGDLDSVRSRAASCSGRPGVLRYKRETTIPSIPCSLPSQPPEPLVVCEACGEEAQPPLDLMGLEQPQLFCCSQHQQLCEMLTHERLPALRTAARETTPPPDSQPTREEEAELQAQEREEHRKQEVDRELLFQDNSHLPVDTTAPHSRTLSYLLSRSAPRSAPRTPASDPGLDPGPGLQPAPGLDQQNSQFGLSYPGGLQVGAAVVQRSYPSGGVFLTAFPDGSAQILYPSGLLALILLVDGVRRVCLVYDDHTPNQQPIRALFHSDGRATCYHSNGSVWLSLGVSGGECVSETGSRLRRWSWGPLGPGPPASMRPLFLSLNPSLGLRVLGNKQLCLRFLSGGCQARIGLGGQPAHIQGGASPIGREGWGPSGSEASSAVPGDPLQPPALLGPQPRTPGTQAPGEKLHSETQRHRAFIHTCLQDLL